MVSYEIIIGVDKGRGAPSREQVIETLGERFELNCVDYEEIPSDSIELHKQANLTGHTIWKFKAIVKTEKELNKEDERLIKKDQMIQKITKK